MNPLILAYHKIIPDEYCQHAYYWDALCTPYSHFVNFIEELRQDSYTFISLSELPYALLSKEKTVLITFDDGYLNNITYAYPFLHANDIPFCVSVNAQPILNHTWQWHDLVWYNGIQKKQPKTSIIQTLKQFKYDAPSLKMWLETHQKPSLTDNIDSIFFDLAPFSDWIKTHNTVTILNHGYSHTILSQLEISTQLFEVTENIKQLSAQQIGVAHKYFTFPNGQLSDFTPQTLDLLRDLGVSYVFTMLPQTHDTFLLPRWTPSTKHWKKEQKTMRYTSWKMSLKHWLGWK